MWFVAQRFSHFELMFCRRCVFRIHQSGSQMYSKFFQRVIVELSSVFENKMKAFTVVISKKWRKYTTPPFLTLSWNFVGTFQLICEYYNLLPIAEMLSILCLVFFIPSWHGTQFIWVVEIWYKMNGFFVKPFHGSCTSYSGLGLKIISFHLFVFLKFFWKNSSVCTYSSTSIDIFQHKFFEKQWRRKEIVKIHAVIFSFQIMA